MEEGGVPFHLLPPALESACGALAKHVQPGIRIGEEVVDQCVLAITAQGGKQREDDEERGLGEPRLADPPQELGLAGFFREESEIIWIGIAYEGFFL